MLLPKLNLAFRIEEHEAQSVFMLLILKVTQPVSSEPCNYKETYSIHN